MTQTLRRELRLKISEVLHGHTFAHEISLQESEELINELTESIVQLRAFQEKPKFDLKQSDPAWSILAGAEVTQEQIDQNILAKEATEAFAKDMSFGALPWNSDKTWETFYKFVVKVYSQNKNVWREYVQWRNDKGKYTAYSNRKIRENPLAFIDTGYPEFEASKMYADKPKGRRFERLNHDS